MFLPKETIIIFPSFCFARYNNLIYFKKNIDKFEMMLIMLKIFFLALKKNSKVVFIYTYDIDIKLLLLMLLVVLFEK